MPRSFLVLAFLAGCGCIVIAVAFAHNWLMLLAAFGGYLVGFAIWMARND